MSKLPCRGREVGTGGVRGDERGLGKGVADAFVVPFLAGCHRCGAPDAPELVAWSRKVRMREREREKARERGRETARETEREIETERQR